MCARSSISSAGCFVCLCVRSFAPKSLYGSVCVWDLTHTHTFVCISRQRTVKLYGTFCRRNHIFIIYTHAKIIYIFRLPHGGGTEGDGKIGCALVYVNNRNGRWQWRRQRRRQQQQRRRSRQRRRRILFAVAYQLALRISFPRSGSRAHWKLARIAHCTIPRFECVCAQLVWAARTSSWHARPFCTPSSGTRVRECASAIIISRTHLMCG